VVREAVATAGGVKVAVARRAVAWVAARVVVARLEVMTVEEEEAMGSARSEGATVVMRAVGTEAAVTAVVMSEELRGVLLGAVAVEVVHQEATAAGANSRRSERVAAEEGSKAVEVRAVGAREVAWAVEAKAAALTAAEATAVATMVRAAAV